MVKGMFEEFLQEIQGDLDKEHHPLSRIKEEKKFILDALTKLRQELRFIEIHGKWKEAEEPLLQLKNIGGHHEKLNLFDEFFIEPEDLYYRRLMRHEQEAIEESLDELLHIFLREDINFVEKIWRVEALTKLIQEQDKREDIFLQMLEEKLTEQEWREKANQLEAMGYLMGRVEPYNPTLRRIDPSLKREEFEAIVMALPLRIAYENSRGELLLLKDFAPDLDADWIELPEGLGKIYFEEEKE